MFLSDDFEWTIKRINVDVVNLDLKLDFFLLTSQMMNEANKNAKALLKLRNSMNLI